jgi:hypothetical protein
MGDFNAHHTWWSAQPDMESEARQHTRVPSNAIAQWLESHRFQLHNKPRVFTRFPVQRGTTSTGKEYMPAVLDLALSRGPIGAAVMSWGIDDSTDSDHRSITLHLSLPEMATVEPVYFRDWRSADWAAFDTHVSRLDLDRLSVPVVTKILLEAIEAAAPLKVRKPGKKFALWWTPELGRLQARVKAARRRARRLHIELTLVKRSECPEWAAYDSLQVQWKKAVSHARSQYIEATLASADHQSIWRILKRHQAHRPALPKIDGAEDFEGKCAALRTALFPPTADAAPEPLRDGFVQGTADLRDERQPVTRAEIDRVIARLHACTTVPQSAPTKSATKSSNAYTSACQQLCRAYSPPSSTPAPTPWSGKPRTAWSSPSPARVRTPPPILIGPSPSSPALVRSSR